MTGPVGSCTVVFYHYVRDTQRTPFPAINALAVADFLDQLEALRTERRIVDHRSVEAALDGGPPLADPSALLTFDDGFIEHYTTVFPILRERALTAVFFLSGAALGSPPHLLNVHKTHFLLAKLGGEGFTTAVYRFLRTVADMLDSPMARRAEVYRYDGHTDSTTKHLLNYELPFDVADRLLDELFRRHIGDPSEFAASLYISRDMVREMADAGMTFGFHTESHRVLSRLSLDEQRTEIAHGVGLIRDLTGQRSVPFCYPYGHRHTYNTTTLALLRECGYSTAFTTARRPVRVGIDDRFELPRFDTRDLPIRPDVHA